MSTGPGPAAAVAVERSEELRLALVLNGGVSLAVWMGGVAFELNRLVRETHPVYRGLLELTGTAARIDVISGTSAGGINGAALALAQIHDRSLYGLRDMWLETAGLERLMRDPDDPDPRSLLRGDDWFQPQIRRAFADLTSKNPAPADAAPVLLSLTSTLLDGIGHRRLDDFGATVEDTVHRALWRFERADGAAGDAFARVTIVEQLALAARSTASFPVAFEPVEVDPEGELLQDGRPLRARLSPDRELEGRSFLIDGGILDNQPFDAALDGIARLPAQGDTRRVLAYIVPDPAAAAERRKKSPDGSLPKPTLAEVAWRSLVSIPASQSIASHMARLRTHNDDTGRRWQRLVGAVRHVGAAPLIAQASTLLPAYRARRRDGIIDYLLEEIEIGLAAGEARQNIGMRRATRQWLRSVWRATETTKPELWVARVPGAGDFEPAEPLVTAAPPRWPFGLYAVEFVAEWTVELLRRTQRLHGLIPRWSQHPGSDVLGPALPVRDEQASQTNWEGLDQPPSAVGEALRSGASRIGQSELRPAWQRAYAITQALRRRRRQASEQAERTGGDGFVALVKAWSARGGEQPPIEPALDLIERLLGHGPEDEEANAADARALCELIAGLQTPIERILVAHEVQASARADLDEAVVELRAVRDFLYQALPGDAAQPLDRIAWRVLALEVFEVSAGSRARAPNVQAEVVQISARLRSAWGGSSDPAAKLSGMQLAHFGAFYKRSWRANDWTFGRLDGIDRAVRIALNPDALQRRFGRRAVLSGNERLPASVYVMRYLRALAVDTADEELQDFLRQRWEGDAPVIAEELRWLDQPSTLPPPVLDACANALTRRLQLEALRRELPEIAKSLIAERDSGAPPSRDAGVALLARVAPDGRAQTPSPEDAVILVQGDLLGSERLDQQPGTDHFTRTASQGLATAHAAMSSKYGGLNAIQVLLKVTEWPVRIVYTLTNRLAGAGGTAAALEGAVLGVGAALVAAGVLTDKLPGAALGMGWALLGGAIAATLLRSLWLGWALAALVVLGVALLELSALWKPLLAGAALVLLLLPGGAVFAMIFIVLGAAWWSAGASTDAVALLWQQYCPWAAPAAVAPKAEQLEQLGRLKQALGPALLVVALVMVSAASRTLAGALRRTRMRAVDRSRQALHALRERWARRA